MSTILRLRPVRGRALDVLRAMHDHHALLWYVVRDAEEVA